MDEIIQRIINTERLAQNILEEAKLEMDSHESEIDEEIRDYQYKAYKDAWSKIDKYANEQQERTDEKVRVIEKSAQDHIAEMQKSADLHKDEWIGYFYKKILDGDVG